MTDDLMNLTDAVVEWLDPILATERVRLMSGDTSRTRVGYDLDSVLMHDQAVRRLCAAWRDRSAATTDEQLATLSWGIRACGAEHADLPGYCPDWRVACSLREAVMMAGS